MGTEKPYQALAAAVALARYRQRGRQDLEYELIDTGVFDDGTHRRPW